MIPPPPTPSTDFPALRILVVDDNRTNLLLLQPFLNRLGHQTTTAEDGQQAVARCLEERPDLILLDIMMPVMDGFEAARHIRAQTRDHWVPIIFLSALDRNENLLTGLEAGGDDFISKPINFVLLEAKLRAMQRMLRLQRQVAETSKRIEAISDNIVDALITIDTSATIVACNKSCERIFGWTAKEMLGHNARMLMPEPYHSEHDASVFSYLQGAAPPIMGIGREVAAQRKDGTVFPAEIGISEIRFESERLFIGILRDISVRKKAEQLLRDNAELLQRYHDESETENQLARSVINTQLLRAELRDQQLHYWLSPAKNFSGDVIAASRSADGKLYAMLADATGHGLTAAISTLPVLTIFYSLAPEGAPLARIVGAINQHLKQSMPVGRFVAATIVCIDGCANTGEVWVGGTPEALLLDEQGNEIRRFTSLHLPLGIADTDDELVTTTVFSWTAPCQLLICSDGLVEAENRVKTPFGLSGLLSSIRDVPAYQRHDFARSALECHLEGLHAHDDVSLMLIDCVSTTSMT